MSMPGLDAERDVAVSWGNGVLGLDTHDLDASRQGVCVCVYVGGWVGGVRERERERKRSVCVCLLISFYIC